MLRVELFISISALTIITASFVSRAGVQSVPARTASDSVRFVEHEEHIQVGLARSRPFAKLVNPFEGNASAVADGGKLFVAYNCADCHGAGGSGAMGPSLQDGRWRFGGSAGAVFQSIYEGRPEGMPSWGGRISDDDIWKLVAYVRTLDAGRQVATENFTSKGVERTGH